MIVRVTAECASLDSSDMFHAAGAATRSPSAYTSDSSAYAREIAVFAHALRHELSGCAPGLRPGIWERFDPHTQAQPLASAFACAGRTSPHARSAAQPLNAVREVVR